MVGAAGTPSKRKAAIYDHPKSNSANKKQKQSDAAFADDIPFEIQCPPKGNNEAYHCEAKIAEGVVRKFDIVTKSGTTWQNIKSYKNVKLGDSTFGRGDIVYILNNTSPPDPPDEEEGEAAFLKWDRRNTFVGEIIESRAESADKVYVLIAYLYWPEEIPPKQQKAANWGGDYYAKGELIKSDFFEIIDATSISSKGDEVRHWDEHDDDKVARPPLRFWRQIFDKSKYDKTNTSPTALTPLRKFCKCSKPYNPDTNMFHHTTSCKAWNHEDCLVEDIGSRIWEYYSSDKMDEYAASHLPPDKSTLKNIGKKVQNKVEEVGEIISPKSKFKSSDTNTASPATKSGKGRPKKQSWKTKLTVSIVADEDDAPLKAVVKEKKTNKTWEIKVDCLTCGRTLD